MADVHLSIEEIIAASRGQLTRHDEFWRYEVGYNMWQDVHASDTFTRVVLDLIAIGAEELRKRG